MNNETAADTAHPTGAQTIRGYLKALPDKPGVYRMLDADGAPLYVGKARSLKKRVTSYTQFGRLPTRIARMVSETRSMVFVTTRTEAEALLLEANLIKKLKPRYNVVLRDDKSFPYILLRLDHPWAQVAKHRGARRIKGEYYGPFASAGAVNKTLNSLQRVFLLRSCSDNVLENRSRPCLLYQIKRCSAPCVGRISEQDYAALVADARAFLAGQSHKIQKKLGDAMEAASDALDYESAAGYRDRLRALAHVQQKQGINAATVKDADVIAGVQQAGQTCVQVFFYRAGQNWGNRAHFLRHAKGDSLGAVLAAFIGQFYEDRPAPPAIIVNAKLEEQGLIAEALSARADRQVRIITPERGEKRQLVGDAERNAKSALDRRMAESSSQAKLLQGVADLFGLEAPPERIEVYDNSHIQGANPVGAMIVAGPEGFLKNGYRKFNIKSADLAAGDDYAMMREVLIRRFSRLMKEDETRTGGLWPDLVVIDGGKGQLSAANGVLVELGLEDLPIVAISKGPDRNAGRETFHTNERTFTLDRGSAVLYYLQRLRDEAHRFAIGTHRARRTKDIQRSPLDEVPGVGAQRKRALLLHFGSVRSIAQAGPADLAEVDGISEKLAQAIYDRFHGS